MPRLSVTILVKNEPLRRCYVEHIWKIAGLIGGTIAVHMTNDKGKFEFDSSTHEADIRILGQNSGARIVEGGGALFVADLWVDKRVEDEMTVRLDTREEKVEHFRILNKAVDLYDTVHRRFVPFSTSDRPAFPLGKKVTLQKTKDQARRIEIVYPDNLQQRLAFVEPKSFRTGYPLVHLKGPGQGAADGSKPLPEELAHALHFSQLDDDERGKVEIDYAKWLISDMIVGGNGHGFNIQTSPMVAYIEAFGLFAERFSQFASRSELQGTDLHKAFVEAELKRSGTSRIVKKTDPIEPAFGRDDVEGAVYGAIFVHFASLVTLGTAVEAYYRSDALTFDQYRAWIFSNMPIMQQLSIRSEILGQCSL